MSGIPLRKEICVANESMRCALGEANCTPTCSKPVLPQNQAKCNERTRGEDKDGKVCHRKQPSQLLYTSLSLQVASYHEVCIIVVTSFFGEELNCPIKSLPNLKYIILAEFANLMMPKFPAIQYTVATYKV